VAISVIMVSLGSLMMSQSFGHESIQYWIIAKSGPPLASLAIGIGVIGYNWALYLILPFFVFVRMICQGRPAKGLVKSRSPSGRPSFARVW